MGCQLRFGTAGATGGGLSHQPGSHQQSFTDQYRPAWDRGGARSPKTQRDPLSWISRWSFGCRVNGGLGSGQDGSAPVGRDTQSPDLFEPYSCDGAGTQSIKFVLGQCVDAADVPVANASLTCITAAGGVGGTAVSREDGTFAIPTIYAGAEHYVVAYKSGSPDTGGTTVNKISPTNLDGT